jgi:hypothetical protein
MINKLYALLSFDGDNYMVVAKFDEYPSEDQLMYATEQMTEEDSDSYDFMVARIERRFTIGRKINAWKDPI